MISFLYVNSYPSGHDHDDELRKNNQNHNL